MEKIDFEISGVQFFKNEKNNFYLAVVSSNLFKPCTDFWYNSPAGNLVFYKLIQLIQDDYKNNKIGIFIHNENATNIDQNIYKIIQFMEHFGKDYEDFIFTFTDCSICSQVASLGEFNNNFSYIAKKNCNCSRICSECIDKDY